MTPNPTLEALVEAARTVCRSEYDIAQGGIDSITLLSRALARYDAAASETGMTMQDYPPSNYEQAFRDGAQAERSRIVAMLKTLPDGWAEMAARAVWEHELPPGDPRWDGLNDETRQMYRLEVTIACAALAEMIVNSDA